LGDGVELVEEQQAGQVLHRLVEGLLYVLSRSTHDAGHEIAR
jgi:hypothetical protein